MGTLADQSARNRALTDHGSTLLVEAGAGTGKTSLLAGRVVMLLASGVRAHQIAVVSFTELAASELLARITRFMRELLRGEVPYNLEAVLSGGLTQEQHGHLEEADRYLDELTCTTIHGFCQTLLGPYPVDANIDPGAMVMDAAQATIAFETVLEGWLHDRLSGVPGDDDVLAELVRNDLDKAVGTIEEIAHFLLNHRNVRAVRRELVSSDLALLTGAIRAFCDWYAGAPEEEDSGAIIEELRSLEPFYDSPVGQRVEPSTLLQLSKPPLGSSIVTKAGTFRAYKKKGKWVAAARAAGLSKADGEELATRAADHYQAVKDAFAELMRKIGSALLLAVTDEFRSLFDRYAEFKRSSALLDFDDLLSLARELLRTSEPVRQALADRFKHILVDEFQDTDPIQAEILFLLTSAGTSDAPWHERALKPGALFLVGDPKQAIYRFRGADVNTYTQARDIIKAKFPGNVLDITSNFRSVAPIVDYANERFVPIFQATGQPGFQVLTSTIESPRHGFSAVSALDVLIEAEEEKPSALERRHAEARTVAEACAKFIDVVPIDNGHQDGRRCRPGDIALLAPTGTELWLYEHELERQGIPVSTQAGKGLFWQQEVQDLIAVVRALADPGDTLAFGALMRGPLVGLSEEELLDIVMRLPTDSSAPERIPRFDMRTDPTILEHEVACEVLTVLQGLAGRADSTTPGQLITQAVEELRVRPILSNRHRIGGRAERALANVDLFLEISRQYSVRGLKSFARDLRSQWEEKERQPEGRVDADQDAVRVITMHSAKGLEWPIVIPINTATVLRGGDDILHRRSDDTIHMKVFGIEPMEFASVSSFEERQAQQERSRLWYVALTRAKDLLVLPRVNTPPGKSWVGEIDIGLSELPPISLSDIELGFDLRSSEETNEQTPEAFSRETLEVKKATRQISWHQPSRHEVGERADQVPVEPQWRRSPVGIRRALHGSALRGEVLHKLLEEILSGEVAEEAGDLETRADELIRQRGSTSFDDPADGPSSVEIAGTAMRALAIPELEAVRDRLIPEFSVFDFESAADGAGRAMSGYADAVAIGAAGEVELVVDWKSDVSPSNEDRARYRKQVGEYLAALGAKRGLVVYMTTEVVDTVVD